MASTIIWIEDDTDIIEPVIRPLQLAGYTFIPLRTAAEALAAIDQIRLADLVLLDMILPPGRASREFGRYPGLEILRELRTVHHIKTPVVVLTVVTRDEIRSQLEELGVSDVVRKPVRPSELKEKVERVLAAAHQPS